MIGRPFRWVWRIFVDALHTFLTGIILTIAAGLVFVILMYFGIPQGLAEEISGR
jgi:hypothetical protein